MSFEKKKEGNKRKRNEKCLFLSAKLSVLVEKWKEK